MTNKSVDKNYLLFFRGQKSKGNHLLVKCKVEESDRKPFCFSVSHADSGSRTYYMTAKSLQER